LHINTCSANGVAQEGEQTKIMMNKAWIAAGVFALALSTLPAMGAFASTRPLQSPLQAENPPAATAEPARRTITVVGIGRASATPDIARVTVGVDVVNASLSRALTEVNTKTSAVIAQLKKQGIEDKDIRTVDFNVFPQQAYGPNGPGPITGYRVSNSVRVTIRELDKAGAILEQAVNAGANTVQGLTFTIEDARPVETEARVSAIQDARFKADALAQEAGATVGQVVNISEVTMGGPIPLNQPAAMDGRGGGGVDIAPGMQDVSIQVQVTYELQ
jgi:uncharacterized protein YggE